ncbi:MAG: (Fe-S)-binding protein [Promethearchaeota archaeon]
MGKNSWMLKAALKLKPWELVKVIKGFLGEKKYLKLPGQKKTNVDVKKLLQCALCPNICKFECPPLRVTHKEMYSPSAKARISYHVLRGNLNPARSHAPEIPYLCTNCDGCKNWCPLGISTGDLLKGVRADLVEAGNVSPVLEDFNRRVVDSGNIFREDLFQQSSDLDVFSSGASILFFPGCMSIEKNPDSVRATISILKKAGVNFSTLIKERVCCGGPLYNLGFRETAEMLGRTNLAMFKKHGIKTIISDCPACVDTIRNVYPTLGLKHKLEVLTTTEFFRKCIEDGSLKLTKPVTFSLTYHDPCITARKLNDIDSARVIISQISGVEFKEAFLHGKETQCCGMGGAMHVHHPSVSESIGQSRLSQLENTGADYIVTACPACVEGFRILKKNNAEKIIDISQIIAKSIE